MAKEQTESPSISVPPNSVASSHAQKRPSSAEWNLIYFGILAVSMLIGVSSYLNGDTVQVALLRFMVFFMVATALTMSFLAFVVVPLQMQRYKAVLQAKVAEATKDEPDRKAQSSPSTETGEADQDAPLPGDDVDPLGTLDAATVEDLDAMLELQDAYAQAQSSPHPGATDDQASGLRRMVAAD